MKVVKVMNFVSFQMVLNVVQLFVNICRNYCLLRPGNKTGKTGKWVQSQNPLFAGFSTVIN